MSKASDGRILKGQQTREVILGAAFQLLMEGGPNGFTAGKLAIKAKVSKASLFHHFSSIDEVPFAVLEEMVTRFSGILAGKKPKTVSEYVYQVGKGLLEAPPGEVKVVAAFVHFYLRSAHDEKFRAQQEKTTRSFLHTLEKGFEDVLGRKLTPKEREVAPLLVAMCIEGMGFFSITFQDRSAFKKVWQTLADTIEQLLTGDRS